MNKNSFNICNLYIFIWYIYLLQGPLSLTGGMITRLLLVINILISLYFTFYANFRYKLSSYFHTLNILLIIFTIYGVARLFGSEIVVRHGSDNVSINNFEYLKSVYISLLPVYPFYVFTKKGYITDQYIRRLVLLLFFEATLLYFHMQHQNQLLAQLAGSSRDEFTNNQGYLFLWLLPIVTFFRKKIFVQYLLLAYCMLFIVMGMKRGVILIGFVALIYFFATSIKGKSIFRKFIIIVFFALLLAFVVYIVLYYLNTSDYFNARLNQTLERDSSGRDIIYSRCLDYFLNKANPLHFLFGSGADATIRLIGSLAHNDWLELAINQGLMGIVIYLFYWFCFYKEWRKSKKHDELHMALGLLFIILFMQTFFSMSYNAMVFYESLVLGYCLANNSRIEF